MKVLIGYDGSESANAIFDDLKCAGLPRDTEAIIASAADLLASNAASISEFDLHSLASRRAEAVLRRAKAHTEQVIEEKRDLAAKAAKHLRTQFPEWKIESLVKTGTPTWELIDAANDWNADLIVIGSHGRSAIGRLFLGSVSKRIAKEARCSVRVARSSTPKNENDPLRIIIGVDGSPAAEQAIYAVGQRVWQNETEIILINVNADTPPDRIATRLPQASAMIDRYFQSHLTRVSSMLDWATAELSIIGLKTSVVTKKGDPKTILLEEASRRNADCIFVGTRDFKSAFERFRLGSVSTTVVTNALCTVEIVRLLDRRAEII